MSNPTPIEVIDLAIDLVEARNEAYTAYIFERVKNWPEDDRSLFTDVVYRLMTAEYQFGSDTTELDEFKAAIRKPHLNGGV